MYTIFIAIALPGLHEESHDIGGWNTVLFHLETCARERKKQLSPQNCVPGNQCPLKWSMDRLPYATPNFSFHYLHKPMLSNRFWPAEPHGNLNEIKGCNQPCIVGFIALVKLFRKHGIWSEGTGCLFAQIRLHSQIVYQPSDGIMVG
jgi:hypothetical protein